MAQLMFFCALLGKHFNIALLRLRWFQNRSVLADLLVYESWLFYFLFFRAELVLFGPLV